MNELELDQCLRSHPLTRAAYQGVCARDELLNQKGGLNTLYIINTDKRKDTGQHWVLYYWPSISKYPIYFDSYGDVPLFTEIHSFLVKSSDSYYYNKQQLQGVRTTVCGQYVAFFAAQLCAGHDIAAIRHRYFTPRNFNLNDMLITTLFRKEFGLLYLAPSYSNKHKPLMCTCFHK